MPRWSLIEYPTNKFVSFELIFKPTKGGSLSNIYPAEPVNFAVQIFDVNAGKVFETLQLFNVCFQSTIWYA